VLTNNSKNAEIQKLRSKRLLMSLMVFGKMNDDTEGDAGCVLLLLRLCVLLTDGSSCRNRRTAARAALPTASA